MNTYEQNRRIEAFIRRKDAAGEGYDAADKAFIMQYEGSGGQGSKGASGEGVLYEFYTPDWLCVLMWELAQHYGYREGTVLEPSLATGRLLQHAPRESDCYGFEINPVSARIAQIMSPQAHIYPHYFETAFMEPPRFTSRLRRGVTWLAGYPFSLVIGNPPYGRHVNRYSSYFGRPPLRQMELFFLYYGLELLRPGGLLVYLTSSNIIRSGHAYQQEKELLGQRAHLLDAYRLPPVFRHSQVPTDILVLQKV